MKQGAFQVDMQKDAVVDEQHDGVGGGVLRPSRICHLAVISTAFWALVFFLQSSMQGGAVASVLFKPSTFSIPLFSSSASVGPVPPSGAPPAEDRCAGRYIYMYDLPPRFNTDLVRDCGKLNIWVDMCPYVANSGMGEEGGAFSARGWFGTDQFMLDVIFHGRMPHRRPVPRRRSVRAVLRQPGLWLAQRPEWLAAGGRDHFFVAGRTAVEFSRIVDKQWGTSLLRHPAMRDVTALVLETVPWTNNDVAVPYPTYFHPEMAADVAAWQERVRHAERRWLFSFAGAPRPGNSQTVRAEIIQQCGASSRCSLYHCGRVGGANCSSPGGVMRLMEASTFCLEPRGDSLTRRATFDAVLAGCIPVFFQPGSAYTQYAWHLPEDPDKYSVLIMHTDITARNVSIEETLSKIPPETVTAMSEEVIRLIPKVVYAARGLAFDIAVEAVIGRVAGRR
jgi:xyloglucan galactosyltransferase MUR3